jgi:hypothetical protein
MPTDAVSFFLSPQGVLLTYGWTYASLAAVQLTVRLIMRFDLKETALAALWLTVASIAVGLAFVLLTQGGIDPETVERLRRQGEAAGMGEQAAYLYVVQQRLVWFPLAVLLLGLASWWVSRRALGMRQRSAVISAVALGILVAPWPALAFL